jgi:hypothetical protein
MKTGSRILLAALGYIVGSMLSGMLAVGLHFTPPARMPGTSQSGDLKAMVVAGVILACGLAPLALGLAGKRLTRWLALAAMIYVICGLNTVIEISIFSTFFKGTYAFLLTVYVFSALLAAAAFAAWPASQQRPALPSLGVAGWAWRLCAAWLAFPVIYFLFGMMVGPFVVKYYTSGILGFMIPPMTVIIRTQLLRSALFLAVSLPLVFLWSKSRRGLFVSLGIAHASMVGLMGLASAYWMPMTMRVGHSLEITADSFVYAAVLTLLFFHKKAEPVKAAPTSALAAGA